MKVITIKQPFASLIAEGLKEYEFRTWKTKYRGEILIHAGKGIDKKAMKKFDDTLINPYFSTNLSNFIQSFGAQIISGLILIWIGNTSIELKH